MRSDLYLTLKQRIRDELSSLRNLASGRRNASTLMTTLTRTGMPQHIEARRVADAKSTEKLP